MSDLIHRSQVLVTFMSHLTILFCSGYLSIAAGLPVRFAVSLLSEGEGHFYAFDPVTIYGILYGLVWHNFWVFKPVL